MLYLVSNIVFLFILLFENIYNYGVYIMAYGNNHFTGFYSAEKYSIAQHYRDERKRFTDFINQLDEEYRLYIVEDEFRIHSEKLKNFDSKIFELFELGTWFDLDNRKSNFIEDEGSLIASYLEFLKIVRDQYRQIELIKAGEVKWTGEYDKFIDLFKILTNYNII
jgi:hypothetical protein